MNLPTNPLPNDDDVDIRREGHPVVQQDISIDPGEGTPVPELGKYSLCDLAQDFDFFLPHLMQPCMQLHQHPLELFQAAHPEVPEASPVVLNANRKLLTNLHTVAPADYVDFWASRLVMIVKERSRLLRGFLNGTVASDPRSGFSAVAGESVVEIMVPRRGSIELAAVQAVAIAVRTSQHTWWISPDATKRSLRIIHMHGIQSGENRGHHN